jgi:hypothetical protein
VLQAATSAVSVSWFSEPGHDAPLGELRVIVWRGTVARRGSPTPRDGASVAKEMVLHPIEPPADGRLWRSTEGAEYSTSELAERCLEFLTDQIASDSRK